VTGEPDGRRRAGVLAAGLACVALLAAACTGNRAPSLAGSAGSGGSDRALAFSQCMRAHGITQFPDPGAQGGVAAWSGVDFNSPQYQAAQRACLPKLGGGSPLTPAQQAEMQTRALEFAHCMRSHGQPGYPDPTIGVNGSVIEKISIGIGLNPRSPQWHAAQKACQHFQRPG
jgi:hypothetical protein